MTENHWSDLTLNDQLHILQDVTIHKLYITNTAGVFAEFEVTYLATLSFNVVEEVFKALSAVEFNITFEDFTDAADFYQTVKQPGNMQKFFHTLYITTNSLWGDIDKYASQSHSRICEIDVTFRGDGQKYINHELGDFFTLIYAK